KRGLEEAVHRIVDALHKISKLDYDRKTNKIVNMISDIIIKIKSWAILNEFDKVKSGAEYAAKDITERFPSEQPTPNRPSPTQPQENQP
ncbi:MAG: hypothetical protein PHW55_07700, partial [Methanothrix sp.]|nr:hypothetical protein [Methanothrix sp.]